MDVCPECGGKGYVELLTSRVECARCKADRLLDASLAGPVLDHAAINDDVWHELGPGTVRLEVVRPPAGQAPDPLAAVLSELDRRQPASPSYEKFRRELLVEMFRRLNLTSNVEFLLRHDPSE